MPQLRFSVRDFVALSLQRGNLASRASQRISAVEGTKAHQHVQASRPDSYQAERSIQHTVTRDGFELLLRGRIDGFTEFPDVAAGAQHTKPTRTSVLPAPVPVLEEIKSTRLPLQGIVARESHWAQVKVYGYFHALQADLPAIDFHLTYVAVSDFDQTFTFVERHTFDDLQTYFNGLLDRFLPVVRRQVEWATSRDQSIAALAFPHADFRRGQRRLMQTVYQCERLFAEAPTGIGKTLSVLFPAIKMIGRDEIDKVFFLTAKGSGKTLVRDTLDTLSTGGLRLKGLVLTNKDTMTCVPGVRCDPAVCENAEGYYDRLDAGVAAMFRHDLWTPERILENAAEHRLCPFDFQLDLFNWADVLIGDYNYAFDPRVTLRRFLDDTADRFCFLIDEAHNLVSRARDMFSSELRRQDLIEAARAIGQDEPTLRKGLQRIADRIADLDDSPDVWPEPPPPLLATIGTFLRRAEAWLARDLEPEWREPFLEAYYEVSNFALAADRFGDHAHTYRFLQEPVDHWKRDVSDNHRAKIFCVDPAPGVRAGLARADRSILFSASLQPMDYYKEMLGAADETAILQLDSPFPPENLQVFIDRTIPTTYRKRDASYAPIADLITRYHQWADGNVLAFFPSYVFLESVADHMLLPPLCQTRRMDEDARAAFLDAFERGERTLGFAVMGGIFGEGIDLVGDRLAGAVVVGVGLPGIGLEQDVIKEHFAPRGFEIAFTYPGWARVLQAAGRVIRSETDQGSIFLIDERYARRPYPDLMPRWWRPRGK